MCLERHRLKSKTRSVEAARKYVCGVGVMKAKIGNMAKSEKYVLWCQALFFAFLYLILPLSISFSLDPLKLVS